MTFDTEKDYADGAGEYFAGNFFYKNFTIPLKFLSLICYIFVRFFNFSKSLE